MGYAIFILYNLLSPLFAFFYLVLFSVSSRRSLLRNLPAELHERLGASGPDTAGAAGKKLIWIHAASVGEVNSIPGILDGIKQRWPGRTVMITTSTRAGRNRALETGKADIVRLAPLDFLPVVSGFIGRLSPCALILVETELWPNTLISAARHGVKIMVINGRISQRSFPAYRLARVFLEKALSGISSVCAQTNADAARFRALGVSPEAVSVTGNIKYDLLSPLSEKSDEAGKILGAAGWSRDRIFTAGSTHQGEEEMVISAFREAGKKSPGLKLVIAPRHPERSKQTACALEAMGIKSVFWSAAKKQQGGPDGSDCVLLDEIGWLGSFYRHSFAAYVGGTFVNKGGHNLLEPAVHSIPVLFGPHTQNTSEAADMLLAGGGGFLVESSMELEAKISLFIKDPLFLRQAGERAGLAVESLRGATSRTLSLLDRTII